MNLPIRQPVTPADELYAPLLRSILRTLWERAERFDHDPDRGCALCPVEVTHHEAWQLHLPLGTGLERLIRPLFRASVLGDPWFVYGQVACQLQPAADEDPDSEDVAQLSFVTRFAKLAYDDGSTGKGYSLELRLGRDALLLPLHPADTGLDRYERAKTYYVQAATWLTALRTSMELTFVEALLGELA